MSAGFHTTHVSLLTRRSVLWLWASGLPCASNVTFLFKFHLARWTAADLMTAYCVHTHKPISTLQDKQQMRSHCYPSQLQDWYERQQLRQMEGVHVDSFVPGDNVLFSFVPFPPWPCLPSWDIGDRRCVARFIAGILMFNMFAVWKHVALQQSIKCNLCPVTPEELKQPRGVVATWPCEFQISPLLTPHDFLSWSIFRSLSTSWHISRTLCSLDHRREANLAYIILKKCTRL